MSAFPPPFPPELPEGVQPTPRWPAWYAGAGFLVGLVGTLIAVGVVAVALGAESGSESAAFTVVATLAQGAVFIGTAVMFASFTLRPRAWHFGLRRTRLWPAVGWAALGMVSFYVIAIVYAAAVQPDVDQGVTEALGADQGTFGLIVAGVVVMVVAPVAEEFFFRGFFYNALRTRFSVMAAATLDGLLFGLIHFSFDGAEGLLLLPPLALLGFIFCLVYERTGSLYPVIAMHAFNNAVAYAVQTHPDEGWIVSLVVGPLMLLATAVAPRLGAPAPRPLPAS